MLNHIEVTPIKIRRKPEKRKNIQFKKFSNRRYFFIEKEKTVCKKFFKKVLQISDGRIDKCVKKMKMLSSSCATDLRGKHATHAKTPANAISNAVKFIKSLPMYESHYARESTQQKKYLPSNLNMKIVYNEYTARCNENGFNPISMYMFRDTFYRKFNLRFKPPSQDTCDLCNKLELKIRAAPIKSTERFTLWNEKSDHLLNVEYLSREYKNYINESKFSADEKIVLVFDLQKILETPKLTTQCFYFKRQLSTYNLCIHDDTHNRSYMYIWHEAIASKGPQEVTSCLIYHLQHFLPEECREVDLYSDSCGGQNRNIKTTVMLSHFLENNEKLRSITQHFFRTGHSYNVCDRKFAIIEKKKKGVQIDVPEDWVRLIQNAKEKEPKFNVIQFNESNFLNIGELLSQHCTNRKVTTEKTPVNWFTFRKISLFKGQPLQLNFETYDDIKIKYDESIEITPNLNKIISVCKRNFQYSEFVNMKLPLLYPDGRVISTEKKASLLELLPFIDVNAHKFYLSLNHTDSGPQDVDVVEILDDSEPENC